jgi:PKD repeat protein
MSDLQVRPIPKPFLFWLLPLLSVASAAIGGDILQVTASSSPWIGQAPLTVQLTATPTILGSPVTGTTCTWTFGDGTPSQTGQTVTHTYTAPGTYTPMVTAVLPAPPGGRTDPNANGWSWTAGDMTALSGTSVVVLPDYFYVIANGTPTSGLVPLTVSFTATTNAGGAAPFTYQWDFGDYSGINTGASPTHTYTMPGIYPVKVVVTDSKGWQSTGMVTIFAAVQGLNVIATATPTSGYAPLGVGFAAAASGGTAPYTFTWKFGDGSTGTGSSVYHTYANPGTYVPMVTATDSTGRWTTTPTASVIAYPEMTGPPMP